MGLSLNGKSRGLQTHVYTGSYPVVPVLDESFEWLRYKQYSNEKIEKKENDLYMKTVNQTTGKGVLDIDFSTGTATITEITKDDEISYNFFEILERFNGKQVNFSIREENPVEPIE